MNKKTRRIVGIVIKVVVSLILVGIGQFIAVFVLLMLYGLGIFLSEIFMTQTGARILFLLFWLIASLILLDNFIFNLKIFSRCFKAAKSAVRKFYNNVK